MAINLIPLKATVFFEPDEYVQHCEDNGTKPSLDGFEEYVINQMKYKGHKQPVIERDWNNSVSYTHLTLPTILRV